VPAQKMGLYMGIFNMFIVLPMILQMLTMPLYYRAALGADPCNVIRLAGSCLLLAAVATCFVEPAKTRARAHAPADASSRRSAP